MLVLASGGVVGADEAAEEDDDDDEPVAEDDADAADEDAVLSGRGELILSSREPAARAGAAASGHPVASDMGAGKRCRPERWELVR